MTRAIDKLCEASVRDFANPYEALAWPETLDADAWWFAPEMVSIHGTGAWEALDEPTRRKLAFFEAVNFFSLNIHGERSLLEGLARRLYRRDDALHTRYLHHFLDEENKHMVYFGNFCMKYAGKVYPDRRMQAGEREYEDGEEDLLFFARILIFEEIVDATTGGWRKTSASTRSRGDQPTHHRDARHRIRPADRPGAFEAHGQLVARDARRRAVYWRVSMPPGASTTTRTSRTRACRTLTSSSARPWQLGPAPASRDHTLWIRPLVAAGIMMDGPQ